MEGRGVGALQTGAVPIEGEDFGAALHRRSHQGPGRAQHQAQLLAPLLQGLVLLFDADDGVQSRGEAGTWSGAGGLFLISLFFTLDLSIHLSLRLRRRGAAVVVVHLWGQKGEELPKDRYLRESLAFSQHCGSLKYLLSGKSLKRG